MLQLDWQLAVVALSLAAAVIYLARRGWKTFQSSQKHAAGANSCGTCGSCSAGDKALSNSPAGFVPFDDLAASKPGDHR